MLKSTASETYAPINNPALTGAATLNNKKIATVDQIPDISDKAEDDEVVKLSGAQTVAGQKTFTSDITINTSSSEGPNLDLQYADKIVKGVPPMVSNLAQAGVTVYDSTGTTNGTMSNTLGKFTVDVDSETGDITSSVIAAKPETDGTAYATIGVKYPVSGNPYGFGPATPSSANGTELATAKWVNDKLNSKANNSDVVKLIGYQTISGTKVFSEDILIKTGGYGGPNVDLQLTDSFAKGQIPSIPNDANRDVQGGMQFYDTTGSNIGEYTNTISAFKTEISRKTGDIDSFILSAKNEANSTTVSKLGLIYPMEGEPYGYGPTPSTNAPNNALITRQYFETNYANASKGGTIKIDGKKGLVISNGVVSVDFGAMPEEQMQQVVLSMVQEGGGISVDSTGKLYVDFESMPTDKFEAMLQTIRVPIWLTRVKNFYVNQATGNDTLENGRGESSNKPFKTISACINYVTENYNLGPYNAYILVSPGTYTEKLSLNDYTRTSGSIRIQPAGDPYSVSIVNVADQGNTVLCRGGMWTISNCEFVLNKTPQNSMSQSYFFGNINCGNGATLTIVNCRVVMNIVDNNSLYSALLVASGYATINVRGNCEFVLNNNDNEPLNAFALYASSSGQINLMSAPDPIQYGATVQGNYTTFAYVSGGYIAMTTTANYLPFTFIVSDENGVSGKRYQATGGGHIQTNGSGPEYFPGDREGTVNSSTYSWYY